MSKEKLEVILETGDVDACVEMFAEATEPERKKLAKIAVTRLREVTKSAVGARFLQMLEHFPNQSLRMITEFTINQIRTAQAAALATASLSQLKGLRARAAAPVDLAEAVLSVRRPPWLGEWVESLIAEGTEHWPLVWRLVQLKLCPRPKHDNYTIGMIYSMYVPGVACLRDRLVNEPEMLNEEIWRIFDLEPRPGIIHLFATGSRPSGDQPWEWGTALVQLAEEGHLPRARLLDVSLGALERDVHEQWSRFYARVHNGLKPTPKEREARVERYAGLLASRNSATVSFALGAMQELDRANRLDADILLGNVGPALATRTKGMVKTALSLLDRAAERTPALGNRAASLALDALLHESAEIHQEVIDLLERHGDPNDAELCNRLRERVEHIASSQRSRALAWLERATGKSPARAQRQPSELLDELRRRAAALDPEFAKLAGVPQALAAIERGERELPPLEYNGTEIPRLNSMARIEPIQNVEELIERVSSFLEAGSDANEFELLLDGISRLCNQRPPDFSAYSRPLRIRIQQLAAQPFAAGMAQPALCALAMVWIDGATSPANAILTFNLAIRHDALRYSLQGFFERHVLAVTERVGRRQAAPLLSAPTHAGGWIDPLVLVDRLHHWQSLDFQSEPADRVLALLRLAPDHRAEALAQAGDLKEELGAAVRYALGSEVPEIGPSAALWAAAARARAPDADDWAVEGRHRGLGPDAGFTCRYAIRPGPHKINNWGPPLVLLDRQPTRTGPQTHDLPSVFLHESPRGWSEIWPRWMATVWPLGREAYFASAAEAVAGHNGMPTMAKINQPLFEPLLDPDVPLKPMALLLLTVGLAAKRPEEHGLAVDALIASIGDGRLHSANLGRMMATLLPTGLIKVVRWVKTLGRAAQISPLHARAVAMAIEQFVASSPALAPRDLSALLELLHELLTGLGDQFSLPAGRTYLSAQKPGEKASKLIQTLLALEVNPDATSPNPPILQALSARIERAEHWAVRAGKRNGRETGRS